MSGEATSGANQTIVVFSGGLDFVVNAYKLATDRISARLFYIDFGKPSSIRELSAAKRIALKLNMPLEIFNLTTFTTLQLGYVDPTAISLDEADIKDLEAFSPFGPRVSGYHVILSLAAYYTQITGSSRMIVGLIKDQIDRLSGLNEAVATFSRHVELLNPALGKFDIEAPLLELNK